MSEVLIHLSSFHRLRDYTPRRHPRDILRRVPLGKHLFPLTNASRIDIGGLDHIVSSLRETIIYPLLYPNLFNNSSILAGAPKGVLLFGPPGCGKTMLAKALAKESGATFINVAISVLTNKWFGESNKLVAGLFSLARKAQPCIIFIDEIDSFLRERTKGDHEATAMMKAEFMTYVALNFPSLPTDQPFLQVMGRTDVKSGSDNGAGCDKQTERHRLRNPASNAEEVCRSPSRRFTTKENLDVGAYPSARRPARRPLPGVVITQMLKETELEVGFPLGELAQRTEGLSGSDLKELCRNAAMAPVREYMKKMGGNPTALAKVKSEVLSQLSRPLGIAR